MSLRPPAPDRVEALPKVFTSEHVLLIAQILNKYTFKAFLVLWL